MFLPFYPDWVTVTRIFWAWLKWPSLNITMGTKLNDSKEVCEPKESAKAKSFEPKPMQWKQTTLLPSKQLFGLGRRFPAEPVFITTCCVYLGEMPTVFRASKKKIQAAGGTRMKTALVDVLGSTLSGETHV